MSTDFDEKNRKVLKDLVNSFNHQMEIEDVDGLLRTIKKAIDLGSSPYTAYIVSGLIFNATPLLKDKSLIIQGIKLLTDSLEFLPNNHAILANVYYNLSNGYHALFNFEREQDSFSAFLKKSSLSAMKDWLRKSIQIQRDNNNYLPFFPEVLVNLGSCFDELGRVVEALDCYEQALEINPNHAMALANKGIALSYYGMLNDDHRNTYLLEAYHNIQNGLKIGVPPEHKKGIQDKLNEIKNLFSSEHRNYLVEKPSFPGYKIDANSELEEYLTEYCIKHKLYLNFCNFCQMCDAAVGDKLVIPRMLVNLNKTRSETSHQEAEIDCFAISTISYLNEVKQDFVSARFIYILSQYKGIDLKFVDKNVRLIDAMDFSVNNVKIQLTKNSFKLFYDILDKVAFFLNDYLALGMIKRDVSFHQLFSKESNLELLRKTENFSINAIYDIFMDISTGPYQKLKDIRNALTHRFLSVKRVSMKSHLDSIGESELIAETLSLAKLVRSVIIYLIIFVNTEELKKFNSRDEKFPVIVANDIPDVLK